MPATAIAPQMPFLIVWRSDGGRPLPLVRSIIIELWSGYALASAYAEKQRELDLEWVRAHVTFGDVLRRSGPAEPGDDDLYRATIDGQAGYAWICGVGRQVLGIEA